jgi:hypothetical protein
VSGTYIYGVSHSYAFTTPACTLTVPSDSLRDTIWATVFDAGDPDDPDLKRIYGWVYDMNGNALSGAISQLYLDVLRASEDTVPYITSSDITLWRRQVLDTTDAAGYFSHDVVPTDNITPAGCTYQWRVKYDNKWVRYLEKKIAPTDTTATNIVDLPAQ